jgi:putative endonuclease
MTYTLYILYSATLDKYYVGFTGDLLEERLSRHNSNHKGFTGGRDWVLKYAEDYLDKSTVLKREKEIKSKKSRKYIESLIARLD